MSSTSRAWVVAAGVGAVEALKDQVESYNKISTPACQEQSRSFSQAKKLSSSSSAMASSKLRDEMKMKQSEESQKSRVFELLGTPLNPIIRNLSL